MILTVMAAAVAMATPATSVGFDPATGAWRSLRCGARELAVGTTADVEVVSDGGRLPDPVAWRLLRVDRASGDVVREAGGWSFVTRTLVRGLEIRRSVRLTNIGKAVVKLCSVGLRTPALRLSASPADYWMLPGVFPVLRRRFDALRVGRSTSEPGWTRAEYGIACAWSPVARVGVAAGYEFAVDEARVSVEEMDGAVALIHRFSSVTKLAPGASVEVGTQVIHLADRDGLPQLVEGLANGVGNGPPADRPTGMAKTVLYEAHPWGRLEAWGADRGMRYPRLTSLVKQWRALGVTAVWLLPTGWPPPWVYVTMGLDRVAPENGTQDELRGFIGASHAAGIRVLADLVVYGVHPDSDDVRRLPQDVWCRNEAGGTEKVWGGTILPADCSNPTWQKHIGEAAKRWATGYGFDGARLDCIGWGQTLNWANPLRAAASIAYGGIELNRVVRDAFRGANRAAFLLPEGGKPLVFRQSDMVFDYPLYLAMRDMTWATDPGSWIRSVQEWLEWERMCYPTRARGGLVRFLELHDTVAATEYFGVGPSQALMAACVFMQGTPLIQQEQEIGFSADLSKWLWLRNREPSLCAGEASYTGVRCSDPRVLALARTHGRTAALVAVNMSGKPVRCTLSWPTMPRGLTMAFDGLRGGVLAMRRRSVALTLAPYRPGVALLRQAGSAAPTPPPPTPPGARWFVRTPEGDLEDSVTYHSVSVRPGEQLHDALPTLRRAWRPLQSGLLDGGDSSVGVRVAGRERRWPIAMGAVREVALDGVGLTDPPRVTVVASTPTGAARDAGRSPLPAGVTVDAQFVRMQCAKVCLTLSRRHGGAPVSMRSLRGGEILRVGADLYSDYGLFRKGLYASIDGETNPRLAVTGTADRPTVTFTGLLRERAWNGVQTCAAAGPAVPYRLTWTVLPDGVVEVEMAVRPATPSDGLSAFLSLRIPLAGRVSWRRGAASGVPGQGAGDRFGLGQAFDPLMVATSGGGVEATAGGGLQRLFLVGNAEDAYMYAALLDGEPVKAGAGQEIVGRLRLRVR